MLKYKKINKKVLFILLAVLLVAGGTIVALESTGKIDLINNDKDSRTSVSDTKSKTTSDAASAQADFNSGDDRQPAANSSKPEATVSDTRGTQVSPSSQSTTSADKVITVYSPAKNALITNGSSISGSASVTKVSFRLIDNVTGVIATGQLSVVSGNFSGNFNFSTSASEGRLDVFNTRADGTELSIVEIPVRFK